MATSHTHRVLIIAPVSRVDALNTWFEKNIDPEGGANTFTVMLRPSATPGVSPTHAWCCGAFTEEQMRAIFLRLLTLAGVSQPARWLSWTRQERREWLESQLPVIRTATGIHFRIMDNEGSWERGADIRTDRGLTPHATAAETRVMHG